MRWLVRRTAGAPQGRTESIGGYDENSQNVREDDRPRLRQSTSRWQRQCRQAIALRRRRQSKRRLHARRHVWRSSRSSARNQWPAFANSGRLFCQIARLSIADLTNCLFRLPATASDRQRKCSCFARSFVDAQTSSQRALSRRGPDKPGMLRRAATNSSKAYAGCRPSSVASVRIRRSFP